MAETTRMVWRHPEMAQLGPPAMSAFAPLLGDKRTSRGLLQRDLRQRQAVLFKSIGQRPNPQWRSLNNPTADEMPLQPFNLGNNPIVGLSPHSVRTFWDWMDDRARTGAKIAKRQKQAALKAMLR